MIKKKQVSSIQLAEEAYRLIRDDLSGFGLYYLLGSLPFFSYFIYFIEEMSYGSITSGKLFACSISITAIYFWMRTMHSFACESARRHLQSDNTPIWSFKKFVVVYCRQIRLSGIALPFLLLSNCIPICLGLAFSYSQNLSAFAYRAKDATECRHRSWRTAIVMTGPAHRFLGLYAATWFIVWANIAVLFYFLPSLLSSIFGIQTLTSITGLNLFSTTFLTITLSLSSIVANAFSKSFHTLLCFKYESRETGEDLLAKLVQTRRAQTTGLALIAFGFALAPQPPTHATPLESYEQQPASFQEESLFDEQAKKTLSSPEYSWRLPPSQREGDAEEDSLVASFLNYIADMAKSLGKSLEDFIDWLFNNDDQSESQQRHSPSGSYSGPSSGLIKAIALIAIALAIILIAIVIFGYKRDHPPESEVNASALTKTPDLEDEATQASDMPYDKWLALAAKKADEKDFRLAIRAVFLATLSLLNTRHYIKISKSKANFEYARELSRRGALAPTEESFQFCRTVFDATWYGLHCATETQYTATRSNYERLEQSTREAL